MSHYKHHPHPHHNLLQEGNVSVQVHCPRCVTYCCTCTRASHSPLPRPRTNNALLWFLPCSRRPGSRQREPAICPPTLPCDPEHSPQYEVIRLPLAHVSAESTPARALFHSCCFFLFLPCDVCLHKDVSPLLLFEYTD